MIINCQFNAKVDTTMKAVCSITNEPHDFDQIILGCRTTHDTTKRMANVVMMQSGWNRDSIRVQSG